MATITETGFFESVVCGKCNTKFFITNQLHQKWLETGEGWYCPLGHEGGGYQTQKKNSRRRLPLLSADLPERGQSHEKPTPGLLRGEDEA